MLIQFVRPLVIVALALMVPIVPFLSFGPALEARLEALFQPPPPPWLLASLIAGVLSSDIFLPVPSSTVCTLAGVKLGPWLGTAASWAGMTAGAMLGFALARRFGQPLAQRFAGRDALGKLHPAAKRYGPFFLALTRALPVVAEASVLLVGAAGLSWRSFFIPVAAANFGIALAYAAFGNWAAQYELVPIALALSIALPVLATATAWRLLPKAPDN